MCLEHISYIIWCWNPQFGVLIPLGMAEWCIPFWVTLTLTLTSGLILGFSCLEHISYITANFPQMCLMLDQFLLGHSSHDCDISCFLKIQTYKFVTWIHCKYSNTDYRPVLSGHSKRRPNNGFQDQLSLNAGQNYCRKLGAWLADFFGKTVCIHFRS